MVVVVTDEAAGSWQVTSSELELALSLASCPPAPPDEYEQYNVQIESDGNHHRAGKTALE